MKHPVRIVVVAVAKVIILQNAHYYYFYYYHPYPALHNPNPNPQVWIPGDNQRVSSSVFQRSAIIIVVDEIVAS